MDEQLARPKKKQRRQQQLSNINSSSVPLSIITAPTTTPSTTQSAPTINKLSLVEHREHIRKLIKKWCSDNKENFGIENFNLEENVDFFLNIEFDENSNAKGSIKCKCNKSISLAKNDDKLQVSNYYKHLQSVACDHMKNIKKGAENSKSIQQRQQQQSSTPAPLISSSPSHSPLVPVPYVSPTTTETTSHNKSPVSSNPSARGAKRRLVSQSQENHSGKRNRL